jgi:hypothetical protein
VSLALGAEATFVARTIDSDRKHLTGVLRAAAAHRGASFVEIYQNCPIFNDGAFDALKDPNTSADAIIPLTHGEPVRFGVGGHLGVVRDPRTGAFSLRRSMMSARCAVVHDAHLQIRRSRSLSRRRRRRPAPGTDRHLPRRRGCHLRRPGSRAGPAGWRQRIRRRRTPGSDRWRRHLARALTFPIPPRSSDRREGLQ